MIADKAASFNVGPSAEKEYILLKAKPTGTAVAPTTTTATLLSLGER